MGTACTLLYKIPQIYKLYNSKTSKGLSLISYSIQTISYLPYVIHGIIINDSPTFAMGAFSFILNIMLCIQITYYHYKYDNKKFTKFEILALLGGFKAMLFSTYNAAAKIVKGVISKWKKTNSRRITLVDSKIHRLSFSLSDMGVDASDLSNKKIKIVDPAEINSEWRFNIKWENYQHQIG